MPTGFQTPLRAALALILACAMASALGGQTAYSEPPRPKASDAVEKLFDEINKLPESASFEQRWELADQSLAAATSAGDRAGQARAHRAKALFFEQAKRNSEAVAEWREAADAFLIAGDAAGQVEALGRMGQLVLAQQPELGKTLMERAMALAKQETLRPLAAADALRIAATVGILLGNLEWSQKMLEAALARSDRLAPNSIETEHIVNALGILGYRRQDLKSALGYYDRVAQLQSSREPGSMELAQTFQYLGTLARLEKQPKMAADYFAKALAIQETRAPNSRELTQTLDGLAQAASAQEDLEHAIDYERRALEIRKKIAPDSKEMAASLAALGNFSRRRDDAQAARGYLEGALGIQDNLAPDSVDVALVLDELAKLGDASVRDLQRAVEIRRKLTPDSAALVEDLNRLASTVGQQGELEAAASYLREALAIEEKTPPESATMANTLRTMGIISDQQGDFRASEVYLRRALAIHEKADRESISVAQDLDSLASLASRRNDPQAALGFQQRALAIEDKRAPDSSEVARTLGNMSVVAFNMGDLAGSLDYGRRALAIEEKLEPDSLGTAPVLISLANTEAKLGDWTAARGYVDRAVVIQEKFAPDSLDTATALANAGRLAVFAGYLAELKRRGTAINDEQIRKLAQSLGLPEAADRSVLKSSVEHSLEAFPDPQKQWERAEDFGQRAWRIVKNQMEGLTGDDARQAFAAKAGDFAYLLETFQLLNHEFEAALLTVEEARSQAMARLLFERNEIVSRASGDLWSRQRAMLAKLQSAQDALDRANRIPNDFGGIQQRRDIAQRNYQQVRTEADRIVG